ncbi:GNAT family N-acetyltransferase [Amycolatopsis pithecellobii]|uniref:GNAT family N-acetyltransferase n=1 Tax=Amycolatopsis pithecellobii TaxID=664692 RepID=UPI001FE9A0DF|nr:GNAT family N-acetyltransferase [Amycolatopsis pithecellobii]
MTDVSRNDEKHRYEISVDGELAGFAQYADRGDQRILYHTEIAEAFGGRGLSKVLVTGALADVRAGGKRAVPVCPLVASFLRKHPDQADVADEVTPETVQWLDKALER